MQNHREQYVKHTRYFRDLLKVYGQRPEVRVALEVFLTIFTISFFALFAIRPTVSTISSLVAEIRQQKEIGERLDQKIAALQKAQIVWAQEQPRIKFIDQALPKDPSPDLVIKQIEALASVSGVSLENFNIGKVKLYGKGEKTPEQGDQKDLGEYEISVSVGGDWEHTSSFLKGMQLLRRPFVVSGFTYTKSRKEGEENVLLLTIEGVIRYFE